MKYLMRILISALVILSPFVLHAQTNAFEAGINGGFNFSSLRGNPDIDAYHHLRTGYVTGVVFKYISKKYFSFQTGISIERKGSEFEMPVTGLSSTSTGKENFDFIAVPLLAKVFWGHKLFYGIAAGFYYAYLLKETKIVDSPSKSINNTNYYKKMK